MALVLLVVVISRFRMIRQDKSALVLVAGALAIVAAAAATNSLVALKFYPVLVNAGMLVLFGLSLVFPPTVVERIARITEPHLSEAGVRYTRRVTQVWCAFFVVNGSIALVTACFMDQAIWSLYNGLVAYVLMGLVFGIEYLCRIRFRQNEKKQHGK